MLFNSYEFMLFFPVVTIMFFILPPKIKCYWLLVSSYYFYMCWNPKYALLMLFATITSYGCAAMMKYNKKAFLVLGVFLNLTLLFWFKYFNFLIQNINGLLSALQSGVKIDSVNVILPVGISFYVFQVIGYMVDVYRGESPAEKNILRYALFVSFWPQLVAGPIERSGNLLEAFRKIDSGKIRFDYKRVTDALIVILYGFFMKIVIADRIAIFVDAVFADYQNLSGMILLMGALGFTLEIYCDFAGYSLIAIGAAQVYGINLMENFATPYFSRSITEFWRRWHVSLSTWFRDYVYIPLGGNRCGSLRNSLNLMITFLLSGLWHGAAWHYVMWGGVHGVAQIWSKRIVKIKKLFMDKMKTSCMSFKIFQVFLTDCFVVLAWIFFRADSLRMAISYIVHMFMSLRLRGIFDEQFFALGLNHREWDILRVAVFILFMMDVIHYKRGMRIDQFLNSQNVGFKWLVCIFMLCFVLLFGEYGPGSVEAAFIYFQF